MQGPRGGDSERGPADGGSERRGLFSLSWREGEAENDVKELSTGREGTYRKCHLTASEVA